MKFGQSGQSAFPNNSPTAILSITFFYQMDIMIYSPVKNGKHLYCKLENRYINIKKKIGFEFLTTVGKL